MTEPSSHLQSDSAAHDKRTLKRVLKVEYSPFITTWPRALLECGHSVRIDPRKDTPQRKLCRECLNR